MSRLPLICLALVAAAGLGLGYGVSWVQRDGHPTRESGAAPSRDAPAPEAGQDPPREAAAGGRRALLVGVTKYDHLPANTRERLPRWDEGLTGHGCRTGLAVDQTGETPWSCAVTRDVEKEKAVQDRELTPIADGPEAPGCVRGWCPYNV